jgi:hypothetical protein
MFVRNDSEKGTSPLVANNRVGPTMLAARISWLRAPFVELGGIEPRGRVVSHQ